MNRFAKWIGLFAALSVLVGISGLISQSRSFAALESRVVQRPPVIEPDYSSTVIPSNIAALNFMIKEPGSSYRVKIQSAQGKAIDIRSKKAQIEIPLKRWHKLLAQNAGETVDFEIQVRDEEGRWNRYQSITNRIAREQIDGFLVYRLIEPQFTFWNYMGIYQRNLENFDESPVLLNKVLNKSCMNCHSFCNNSADRMLLHMRAGEASGTLFICDGSVVKVNTNTKFTKPGAYPSWHPNGKLVAFSVNKLTQFFHAMGEVRDVFDWESNLVVYNIDSQTITTSAEIFDPDRLETFPCWSADGRSLYFCSTAKQLAHAAEDTMMSFKKIRYDLMRVGFDPENCTWGELETLISSDEIQKSVTMPRTSPDGHYLIFCMAEYGNFPIYNRDCDLYVLDLRTREFYKPDINSDRADTFHSWSSNSHWFVFSSKRRDGLCARPYFSYVDENGKIHKPFLLPQKNPSFYKTFFKTYNVPELVKERIEVRWNTLAEVAVDNDNAVNAAPDPLVKLDQVTGATPVLDSWRPAPQ